MMERHQIDTRNTAVGKRFPLPFSFYIKLDFHIREFLDIFFINLSTRHVLFCYSTLPKKRIYPSGAYLYIDTSTHARRTYTSIFKVPDKQETYKESMHLVHSPGMTLSHGHGARRFHIQYRQHMSLPCTDNITS